MRTSIPSPGELGKRISERRAEMDLTLQAVADKVQVQNSTIYRYEKGEIVKPKVPVIEAIASALDVTPGYLINKPDLKLSNYQQKELFSILDSACAAKNVTHGFAIVRACVNNDFFPRLKAQKLHNGYMYDILAVARFLDVRQEVEDIISKQSIPTDQNILSLPIMKEWKVLGGTACGEPIFRELDDETILAPASIDADFVFRCVGDSMINARIFDGDIVFVKSGVEVENGQIAVVRIGEEYTLKRIYRGEDYLELRAENPMYPARIIRGEQENAEIVGKAVQFLSRVI